MRKMQKRQKAGSESLQISQSRGDKVFDVIVDLLVAIAAIVTIYPLYFVVLASLSDPAALLGGHVFLWPADPDLTAYQYILKDGRIGTGYLNSIIYTAFGTLFGVLLTVPAGYALSRRDLVGRNVIMKVMVCTMYLQGGLIPTYMVIKDLHLVNTRLVMIILGSFTVFNLIIVRTFFMSKIPNELWEAAQLDNCGNGRFFLNIVLPLSKEIVAVIVLYIAVAHWNTFFNALIYLGDQKLFPLQLVLREVLLGTQSAISGEDVDAAAVIQMQRLSETIKYGVMVISTLPIMLLYPFVQKYFVKGVMIGSVKG